MLRTHSVGNAIRVSDIDLHDDKSCKELGRMVAQECVVFVDQAVSEKRLYEIHMLWGQPSRAILHRYVGERLLSGKHWRKLLVHLSRTSHAIDGFEHAHGISRISYKKDRRGKPTGMFVNGELDWHSDRQSIEDSQCVIGLMSLSGTRNSQTTFLCTAPAYDALNHEDRSVVDELTTVWEWDGGQMSEDLLPEQKDIIRYNGWPLPDMACPLVSSTATGRKGFRFPSHSFKHFEGMSRAESLKYRDYLWSLINKPDYIYTRNWQDGQIMFMDQNITLHARPTNIQYGNERTLCRVVSYLDRLYPDSAPLDYITYKGRCYSHAEFAQMADAYRQGEFYGEVINPTPELTDA